MPITHSSVPIRFCRKCRAFRKTVEFASSQGVCIRHSQPPRQVLESVKPKPALATVEAKPPPKRRAKVRFTRYRRQLKLPFTPQLTRAEIIVRSTKSRAKKKGVPYDLDQHLQAIELRLDNGICEASKLPFTKHGPCSLSIDRIIPSLGYVYSNVRFICLAINVAKRQWTDQEVKPVMQAWLNNRP